MFTTVCESIYCPYCGERIDVIVDGSVEFQEYTEDCSVCCQPIVITVSVAENGGVSIQARSEQEC